MRLRIIFVLLLFCGLMISGMAFAEDICSTAVKTESGLIRGLSEKETNTCVWRGIPYAAPPVGDLRWKAPQPAPKWDGIRDGSKWGARCMQKGEMELVNSDPSGSMSEDCLYLNIWRPNKEGKFPVMVWIHGGGYAGGTGNTKMYWGDRLAEKGELVVVTINYRLNAFGFLALPELRKEDPNRSTGNYGSLDQVAALKWVQRNIENFGGDPNNVTIFGESAGGWSICTMLATPLAKGAFHRAILESGGCESAEPMDDGYRKGEAIAEKLGCGSDDLACLRALPAKKIIKAIDIGGIGKGFSLVNHFDGYLLYDTPLAMIRSGNYNWVPLIAGSNHDEVKLLLMFERELKKAKPEEYEARMKFFDISDAELKRLVQLYPLSDYDNKPANAYAQIATDAGLGCPTYLGLQAVAKYQKDVYYYRFDFDDMRLGKKIGAAHSMEIPFVFNSLDRAPINILYGPKQRKLAEPLVPVIQGYWINFARSGNPNGPGLPEWQAFDLNSQKVQVFDTTFRTESAKVADRCAFWDEYSKSHPRIYESMGQKKDRNK